MEESNFGSGVSPTVPSRLATTPTVLLRPGLPQTLRDIWTQFAPATPRATVAGYRRRLWRAHVREVHQWEGEALPVANAESLARDEQLFLIQMDERRPVGFLPEGEPIPQWRRLDRRGATARRRGHGPRARPLLRERPARREGPADGLGAQASQSSDSLVLPSPGLPSAPAALPSRHRERSRSRDTDDHPRQWWSHHERDWGWPDSGDEAGADRPVSSSEGFDVEADAETSFGCAAQWMAVWLSAFVLLLR